jgi:hypothetical protein
MEMSQDERAVTEALDRTGSRRKLLSEARGWRVSWNDLGPALLAALMLFLFLKFRDVVDLALLGGVILVWRDKRMAARLDAIVHLLDREA